MTLSFAADIRPIFRPKDVACMKRFGVLLDRYEYMADPAGSKDYPDHANARKVDCYLQPDACSPRMPYGGPYWTDDQLGLYAQWMAEGFQP